MTGYSIMVASEEEEYDFILISVASGKLELTSRIMTLHNDVKDIVYGCRCVYNEGKKHGLELPLFYQNMDRVFAEVKEKKNVLG